MLFFIFAFKAIHFDWIFIAFSHFKAIDCSRAPSFQLLFDYPESRGYLGRFLVHTDGLTPKHFIQLPEYQCKIHNTSRTGAFRFLFIRILYSYITFYLEMIKYLLKIYWLDVCQMCQTSKKQVEQNKI